MRSTKSIHIIGCHAEGEVGDVIIGGVAPPPGDTLWAQSRHIAADDSLRQFILREGDEATDRIERGVDLVQDLGDPPAQPRFVPELGDAVLVAAAGTLPVRHPLQSDDEAIEGAARLPPVQVDLCLLPSRGSRLRRP